MSRRSCARVSLVSLCSLSLPSSPQTLEWCLELGVQMVTVYAFAIDNFKRSSEEVAQLMALAKDKFMEMIEKL